MTVCVPHQTIGTVHLLRIKSPNHQLSVDALYIALEDRVLVELRRAAAVAGRPAAAAITGPRPC
jgi:hypothetical protein